MGREARARRHSSRIKADELHPTFFCRLHVNRAMTKPMRGDDSRGPVPRPQHATSGEVHALIHPSILLPPLHLSVVNHSIEFQHQTLYTNCGLCNPLVLQISRGLDFRLNPLSIRICRDVGTCGLGRFFSFSSKFLRESCDSSSCSCMCWTSDSLLLARSRGHDGRERL